MADHDPAHVARTLKALDLLATRPVTESELARELAVHPRTARRLLTRLVAEGYAHRAGTGTKAYSATLRLVSLAGRILDQTDLVHVSFPYVTRLRNETKEAAHLTVAGADAAMHLIQETSDSIVMVKPRLGELVPYHCTAVGKALLAHLPDQCEQLLRRGTLERFTDHTIVEPAAVLVELAEIRQRGYAVDNRENSLDLRCVAAPVFDHSGAVVAALGISAPSARLLPSHVAEAGRRVTDVATALSEALGLQPGATLARIAPAGHRPTTSSAIGEGGYY